ncbi:MAG: TolC family protein [candidate division WOR-3 bacterium]|nr:TolC family protein [candidate division WOR-3 bacterium]
MRLFAFRATPFILCLLLMALAFSQLTFATDTLHLTLDSAIERALKNNKVIQIAQEKVKVQSLNKNIALANFFPQINLTGTYTRLSSSQGFPLTVPVYGKYPFPVYNPQTGQLIGITESIPVIVGAVTETLEMVKKDNYNLQGRVSQTLFTWGKLLNAYKIAELNWEIEKENLRKTVSDLKLKTTEAFYQALLADKGLELINESYQQMARHIQQIEKLYQSGLVGRLDLLRAKVQLTNIRSQLLRMENAKNLSYDALRLILGLSSEVPLALKDDFSFVPQEIQLDSALSTALSERVDIKIMQNNLKILKKTYQIQKTANLPSLFSAINYDYKKPYSFTENDWGKDYNVTIGVQMPIFTGGANLYKIKQAKSQLNQIELGLNMLKDAVQLEIKSLYFNLQQEKNILSYQDENVKTAEQALSLAEEKYQNGLITNLEYIDTQLALTQAKFDRLNAIANCILAQIKLLNAIGRY